MDKPTVIGILVGFIFMIIPIFLGNYLKDIKIKVAITLLGFGIIGLFIFWGTSIAYFALLLFLGSFILFFWEIAKDLKSKHTKWKSNKKVAKRSEEKRKKEE